MQRRRTFLRRPLPRATSIRNSVTLLKAGMLYSIIRCSFLHRRRMSSTARSKGQNQLPSQGAQASGRKLTRCLGIPDVLRLDHPPQRTLNLSTRLHHDSRAIEHSNSLLQHDLLHLLRPSRRRGDRASLAPLERVDQGTLADVGVSNEADREGLLDLLLARRDGASREAESLDELHEGLGGGSGGGVGSVDGGGGEVVALLLGGGLEGDGRGLEAEVSEPGLHDGGRDEICSRD